MFTPKGSRERVQQVLQVDGTYADFPFDDVVRFQTLHGVGDAEGVMIVKSSDGVSVVLNDCMFNMDRKRDVLGFLITTMLGSAPGPRVRGSRKWFTSRTSARYAPTSSVPRRCPD